MDRSGEIFDGRYRLQRRLGQGGMAEVYAARDDKLAKSVAVKVLSGECAALPRIARRFEQEARAASRIRHGNVVDVTDVGRAPDGAAYLVMELLRGEDLSATLAREKALPWSRVGPIALQICAALAAAHRAGVIHRDIKPSNCFRLEGGDAIKVLDFGIARVDDPDARTAEPTTAGTVLGTPEYIAPEVAAGEPAGPRSDLYAVGALLYKLLTGVAPFTGANFQAVLSKQIFEPPVPLRRRAPEREIPADVEAIVLRALAKDPAQRQPDMTALAAEVAAAMGQGSAVSPRVAASANSRAPDASTKSQTTPDASTKLLTATRDASTKLLAARPDASTNSTVATPDASTQSLAAAPSRASTSSLVAGAPDASTDSLAVLPVEPRLHEPVTAPDPVRADRRGATLRLTVPPAHASPRGATLRLAAVARPSRRSLLIGLGAAAAALAGVLLGVRLVLPDPKDMPETAGAMDHARSNMPERSAAAPDDPPAVERAAERTPPPGDLRSAADRERPLGDDLSAADRERPLGDDASAAEESPLDDDASAADRGRPLSDDRGEPGAGPEPGTGSEPGAATGTVHVSSDMTQTTPAPRAAGRVTRPSRPRPETDLAPAFDAAAAARALDARAAAARSCALDADMMRGELRLRVAVDVGGRLSVDAAPGARALDPAALACIRRAFAEIRLAPVPGELVHSFHL